jgi:hypothetical protein
MGIEAALLAKESLAALVPVLDALQTTVTLVCDPPTTSPTKDAA